MNQFDLCWFAGFVDGEGTIGLTTDPSRQVLRPQFTVGNTNRTAMEEAKKVMEFILNRPLHFITMKSHRGYRPMFVLRRGGWGDIKKLCTALLPYLHAKKEQAHLLLEIVNFGDNKNGRYMFTEDIRSGNRCQAIVSRMKHLNRRYARNTWNVPLQRETERQAPTMGEETARSTW